MAADRDSGVEFVDERERELFGSAILAEDVRAFLRTHPVGRYLHHRAKQQIAEAQIDALSVDPDAWPLFRGRNKLRQARLRAEVAKAFINWLADALIDGDAAATQLDREYSK